LDENDLRFRGWMGSEDNLDDLLVKIIHYGHELGHHGFLRLAFKAVSLAAEESFDFGVGEEEGRGFFIYFDRTDAMYRFYMAPQADEALVRADAHVHPMGPGVFDV
jgi:hypothetical protein